MTASNEVRPAGWYADPLNALHVRWWDGTEWTQLTQVSTGEAATLTELRIPATAAVPAGSPGAAWYPDPGNPHFQRYWDGAAWTTHVAPAVAQYPGGTTVVVNAGAPKSVGLAFVLTFLFGPLGVFYASITGGLVMTLGGFFGGLLIGLVTLGFGWLVWGPLVWIVSIIWGCVAAGSAKSTTVINRR